MGKSQPQVKKEKKPKTPKDIKKELEAKLFGEKDKKKKKEIQGQIKKIDMEIEAENKKRKDVEIAKKVTIRQLIPVGVDPKTVFCLNFKNKNCNLGEKCQFSHIAPKKEDQLDDKQDTGPKLVCKFLIDALNNREFSSEWVCPLPKCKDLHKMTEMSENTEIELSLEEFLELQRQTIDAAKSTPVTEETFKIWKEKKRKEEELHAKRLAALSTAPKGVDLFKFQPDIFEDDEADGDDIDYHAREEVESDQEE
ncbi:ZC3HF [Enterospora canceri]|uniref:ZC3HF n=1 Tax=Enterospora canceri TaxID=1081671 RepID=A0A1Y1S8L1_9MICR|nr:ZC3HF [Enterospora canceri]